MNPEQTLTPGMDLERHAAPERAGKRLPGPLTERAAIRQLLADLLTEQREALASSWAHKIHLHASFRPSDRWLETLFTSSKMGLHALTTALVSGDYADLRSYLNELSHACLRTGHELGEVSEALLLCKDAILPAISKVHAGDPNLIVALISELDDCLRWATGQFNTLYIAAMNRRLRRQQEQITRMLRLGQTNPAMLNVRDVLAGVAQGIIASVEVKHCDFYLVDEEAGQLTPIPGISLVEQPPERMAAFLRHRFSLPAPGFMGDVLTRRIPLVCSDAWAPPDERHAVIDEMGTQSVLAVPLVAYDRVLAVAVTGTFEERRTFTQEQIELAWEVAQAGSLVLENARLHEQVRQTVALEERERLAREVHDNLAQALGLLRLQASHIEDLLAEGQTEQAERAARDLKQTAAEAHVDAREAIFSLRHSAATPTDFRAMLSAQQERFATLYGITVQVHAQEAALAALPAQALVQLTRILQEALANVRKHARARRVLISLTAAGDQRIALIEDDGRGFDPALVTEQALGGVGLSIMRERAESVGGGLRLETAPGQGVRITVTLPISERR